MNFEHSEEQSLLREMVVESAGKKSCAVAVEDCYEGNGGVSRLVGGSAFTR